jgi:hypothetical protein
MARRQQSGALESALSQIVEVYDAPTLYLDPETLARGQRLPELHDCDVVRPALTALFLVPYDQLGHLAARGEYGRGTLQQILLADAGPKIAAHKYRPDEPPPREALAIAVSIKAHAMGELGNDESPNNPLDPLRPFMTDEGWAAVEAGMATMRAMTAAPDLQPYRGMAHGYAQSALRLAAVLAAWDDQDEPTITAEIGHWCAAWAAWCLQTALEELRVQGSDDGEKDVEAKILDYLRRYNDRAYSERDLRKAIRPYRTLPPDRRAAVMASLTERGLVAKVERKGVAGRPTVGYVSKDHRSTVH